MNGENALPIFALDGSVDTYALDRIVLNTRAWEEATRYAGTPSAGGAHGLSYSLPGSTGSSATVSNIVSAGRIGELSRPASCPFMQDYGVARNSPGAKRKAQLAWCSASRMQPHLSCVLHAHAMVSISLLSS